MAFFSTCHIVLGVDKLQQITNKKYRTVGDASLVKGVDAYTDHLGKSSYLN